MNFLVNFSSDTTLYEVASHLNSVQSGAMFHSRMSRRINERIRDYDFLMFVKYNLRFLILLVCCNKGPFRAARSAVTGFLRVIFISACPPLVAHPRAA